MKGIPLSIVLVLSVFLSACKKDVQLYDDNLIYANEEKLCIYSLDTFELKKNKILNIVQMLILTYQHLLPEIRNNIFYNNSSFLYR